jgi:hypothetical protein
LIKVLQEAAVASFMVLQEIHIDKQKKTAKILCHDSQEDARYLCHRKKIYNISDTIACSIGFWKKLEGDFNMYFRQLAASVSIAAPSDSTAREETIYSKSTKEGFRSKLTTEVSHCTYLHS